MLSRDNQNRIVCRSSACLSDVRKISRMKRNWVYLIQRLSWLKFYFGNDQFPHEYPCEKLYKSKESHTRTWLTRQNHQPIQKTSVHFVVVNKTTTRRPLGLLSIMLESTTDAHPIRSRVYRWEKCTTILLWFYFAWVLQRAAVDCSHCWNLMMIAKKKNEKQYTKTTIDIVSSWWMLKSWLLKSKQTKFNRWRFHSE